MEKRICLLAGYDKDNVMQDYVVFLAKELAKISDVFYYADADMNESMLKKIRPYVNFAASSVHFGQDFGSWKMLIDHLGWPLIEHYDEMIICNDTIYGPMTNMQDIFDYMSLRNYDFWGLTENYDSVYYLDSYFMVFTASVLNNLKFQEFWNKMTITGGRKSYESVLTPFLTELGFVGNSYIKNYRHEDMLANPLRLIKNNKMPFVRVKSLLEPKYHLQEPVLFIDDKIERSTGYDKELIKKHLVAADAEFKGFGINYYFSEMLQNLKSKIENFLPRI